MTFTRKIAHEYMYIVRPKKEVKKNQPAVVQLNGKKIIVKNLCVLRSLAPKL